MKKIKELVARLQRSINLHKNWEIRNYFVISTAHITCYDNYLLNLGYQLPIIRYTYEYGYYIHIPEHLEHREKDILEYGLSKEFYSLMLLAKKNDCHFLNLDADGLIFDPLPEFDW